MARQQGWLALILALAISAGALLAAYPLQLGLDLRGGSQLTLEVMPAGAITKVTAEQRDAVKEVLERRINGLGVAESTLQTVGDNQLVLQLPGEQDPSRAAKVLGTTALLEFRAQKPGTEQEMQGLLKLKRQVQAVLALVKGRRSETKSDPNGAPAPPPTTRLSADERAKALSGLGLKLPEGSSEADQLEALLTEVNRRIIGLYEPPLLTGKDLVTAGRQQQQTGQGWDVTLSFNQEGGASSLN